MSAQEKRAFQTRPESVRQANEEIAEQAERYRFRARVPMLCECSNPACAEIVLVGLEEYRRRRRERDFLTAPGHEAELHAA